MLDKMQQNHIINLVNRCAQNLREQLDSHKIASTLQTDFDLKGATWGMYVNNGKKQRVRFNPILCAEFYNECEEVVAHEVSHYAVDQVFGLHKRSIKPHGKEWKLCMQLLGFLGARATYKQDTSQLALKRQRRFSYRCACREHSLSTTRHRRIIHQGTTYFCQFCKTELVASETTQTASADKL